MFAVVHIIFFIYPQGKIPKEIFPCRIFHQKKLLKSATTNQQWKPLSCFWLQRVHCPFFAINWSQLFIAINWSQFFCNQLVPTFYCNQLVPIFYHNKLVSTFYHNQLVLTFYRSQLVPIFLQSTGPNLFLQSTGPNFFANNVNLVSTFTALLQNLQRMFCLFCNPHFWKNIRFALTFTV